MPRKAVLYGTPGPGVWDAEYTIGSGEINEIKTRAVYVAGLDVEAILKNRLGAILKVNPEDVHIYMAVKLGR